MGKLQPHPNHRGDPLFLPDVFRAFGVNFREDPGWKQWGMGDFGRIQGVFWHHTGARNTSARYIRYNPGLSNALSSQLHLNPKGLHTIVGAGIAWHAGRGWGHGWAKNNANPVSIGIEMQHNGTDPWPEAQLESARRATAAILYYLGHDATIEHMIGHWEYSRAAQGKWDPGKGDGVSGHVMDMEAERRKVQAMIDSYRRHGTVYPPKPKPRKETDVDSKILKDVWIQLRGVNGKGWPQLGKNSKGQDLTLVDGVAAARRDIAELSKNVSKLAEKIEGK